MVGIVEMYWQDVLAVTLAAACAVWVLWTTLRPFVRKVASACGMCAGCSPEQDAASPDTPSPAAPDDLLQIAPPDAGLSRAQMPL